jgi:hypothetical protein
LLRIIFNVIFTFLFLFSNIYSQSSVILSVNTNGLDKIIPDDFIGESFEAASIRLNNNGVHGYFFDSTNTQLITLFHELGIKDLRIGGGTVDNVNVNPTKADIDALFRFAKATGIKVIYSVRLRSGKPDEDAAIAKYVWDHYRSLLVCFAIGNEPDWHSFHIVDPEIYETEPGVPGSAYPSFLKKWREIAKAILKVVPKAKFTGPDTGSNYPVPDSKNTYYDGKSWTVNFAEDEKDAGIIKFVDAHNYVGQDAEGQHLTPQVMINRMLSASWDTVNYPSLYNNSFTPVLPKGIDYRLTESNSFSGGVKNGSNCFATALFALDYLHWWAEHNCLGVNFHTTQWRYNGTFYHDDDWNYHINPMGYGIKAFDIGGHGRIAQIKIDNLDKLDLRAYAVKDTNNLYVTIINKEHGDKAVKADVIINAAGFSNNAKVMFLLPPNGNVGATKGMTLGGSAITNSGTWQGKWKQVKLIQAGQYKITVPASSAAIVKIPGA